MEGVADACATDQNARSSSLESMDHQALQTKRQHLRRPRAARTLDALGRSAPSTSPSRCRRHRLRRTRGPWQTGGPASLFPPRKTVRRTTLEMKRGSEEKGTEQDAKKPKETAAPAPAPKKDEPPICNVGNLLEICDQDVDFAVELVGEGGQEMTGHAAKAVSRATSMDDAWLRAVRKSDFKRLQFLVCRGVREVLLSGYGRVYLSEIVSEFELKTWPRCRDSLIDFHTGSRRSRRTRTPSRASPVI